MIDISKHFTKILAFDEYKQTITIQPGVIRDELKKEYLKQKYDYELTLKNISQAKLEYKDKKYFENLIKSNLKSLEKSQQLLDKNI